MRPLRLLLLLLFTFTTLLILSLLPRRHSGITSPSRSVGNPGSSSGSVVTRSRFSPFFSFHSPLFPSSAIISLTDDNSTFFLSRPAAFGPNLPSHGLSGQLWVGRGFGMDDPLGRLGMMSDVELGCSDVPGWDESRAIKIRAPSASSGYIDDLDKKSRRSISSTSSDDKSSKSGSASNPDDDDSEDDTSKSTKHKNNDEDANDGTDDYLNRPFMLNRAHVDDDTLIDSDDSGDANLRTLQESAEIQGKVVLLSRGGCGFLEKVKWTQRRGGIALIVGDNIPGGALVTMYAKGDTTNITIPSIFTSYTTAHLLSSLIPSGGERSGVLGVSSDSSASKNENSKGQKQPTEKESSIAKKSNDDGNQQSSIWRKITSCLRLSCSGNARTVKTTSSSVRPPSSGRHDWVMVEDFDETKKNTKNPKKEATPPPPVDNFVIGVQDWRNPDVVRKPTATVKGQSNPTDKSNAASGDKSKGGSANSKNEVRKNVPRAVSKDSKQKTSGSKSDDDKNAPDKRPDQKKTSNHLSFDSANVVHPHEGLWVTLTPTAMSSSPFIDTLLVLVVSPLVTLTVVYAMLLIRSRIRRRRWRAPKSVVERLPVRTYHTISSNSGTGSSTSLAASVTAPLLTPGTPAASSRAHSRQRPKLGKSRPRSRTTGQVYDQSSSTMIVGSSDVEGEASPTLLTPGSVTPSGLPSPSFPALGHDEDADGETLSLTESEKREKGLAEWRRRYGGRQRECVVCLEEYVDGVSKVMSLPCGHEFHADCITPWLTTRRRTCPICKGDVVRSLARQDMLHPQSQSHSPFQRYRDSPSTPHLRADDDDGFEEDDHIGPLEDGPLPPFVGNEQPTAYPFSASASAIWRDWSSWGQRAYISVRDWAADQYSAAIGSNRGRRRRRRGDANDDRDR